MNSFLEFLKETDIQWFNWINHSGNAFTDVLFWTSSQGWSWAIVLVAFFLLVTLRKDTKNWPYILLGIGLCFLFADRITVMCFKNLYLRPRPCHVLEGVRIFYGHCGGAYSFISSHAANIFALATFLSFSYRNRRPIPYLLFLWAIIVAYSRPYLGVHYPLDIICGAVVGLGVGSLVYFIVFKIRKYFVTKAQKKAQNI